MGGGWGGGGLRACFKLGRYFSYTIPSAGRGQDLAGVVGPLADLRLVALEVAVGVADAGLTQLDLCEGAVDLLGGEVGGAVRVGAAEGGVLPAVLVDEPLAVEPVDELHPVEAPLRRDRRAQQAEGDGAVAELAEEGVLHPEAEVDVVDDLHLVLVLPLQHPLLQPGREGAVLARALRVEARRVPADGLRSLSGDQPRVTRVFKSMVKRACMNNSKRQES